MRTKRIVNRDICLMKVAVISGDKNVIILFYAVNKTTAERRREVKKKKKGAKRCVRTFGKTNCPRNFALIYYNAQQTTVIDHCQLALCCGLLSSHAHSSKSFAILVPPPPTVSCVVKISARGAYIHIALSVFFCLSSIT